MVFKNVFFTLLPIRACIWLLYRRAQVVVLFIVYLGRLNRGVYTIDVSAIVINPLTQVV